MTEEAKTIIELAKDLLEDAHRILDREAKARRERDTDREKVMDAICKLSEIDLGAETAWQEFVAIPPRSQP